MLRYDGVMPVQTADKVIALSRDFRSQRRLAELLGVNPHLRDRRPVDLIRAGNTRELLEAIEAEAAGSYA